MKLESVGIQRFRSIEKGELPNCGGFNVLIGRNNSGKSNILAAIDAFFTCTRDGNLATLDPPVGREIDYFGKRTELPIDITLTFSLSSAGRDSLIGDIVAEAPQMKNAADGIDSPLTLSATLSVLPPPDPIAFISTLSLEGTEDLRPREEWDPSHRNNYTVFATGLLNSIQVLFRDFPPGHYVRSAKHTITLIPKQTEESS